MKALEGVKIPWTDFTYSQIEALANSGFDVIVDGDSQTVMLQFHQK